MDPIKGAVRYTCTGFSDTSHLDTDKLEEVLAHQQNALKENAPEVHGLKIHLKTGGYSIMRLIDAAISVAEGTVEWRWSKSREREV